MRDWLIINLRAPLMSFGGVTVDSYGPTTDFPSKSMMSGLIANALGLDRSETVQAQDIQDRMAFGCAIAKEGRVVTDIQNATLSRQDKAWQTSGIPTKRNCGDASFEAPERRKRQYIADGHVLVALRMRGKGGLQTEQVEAALNYPQRPIFIGRKHCIPSMPLVDQVPFQKAETAYDALRKRVGHGARAQWDIDEGPTGGPAVYQISSVRDLKNWGTDTHQGSRRVVEGDT